MEALAIHAAVVHVVAGGDGFKKMIEALNGG